MCLFQQKLKHVKHRIKIWNKEVFENIFDAKLLLENELRWRIEKSYKMAAQKT